MCRKILNNKIWFLLKYQEWKHSIWMVENKGCNYCYKYLSISRSSNCWGLQNDLYVVRNVRTNFGSAYIWYVRRSTSFKRVPPLISGLSPGAAGWSSNTILFSESSIANLKHRDQHLTEDYSQHKPSTTPLCGTDIVDSISEVYTACTFKLSQPWNLIHHFQHKNFVKETIILSWRCKNRPISKSVRQRQCT